MSLCTNVFNIIISNYIGVVFMEVEVVARKWGNSLGVTLPKEAVEQEGIKENERFFIDIHKEKKTKVKDFFGLAKGWTVDSQKTKDKLREEDNERKRVFF